MAKLTTTFLNILNNKNYYARIYPVNPQGSMQSELDGQVTTNYVTPTGSISLSQLSEGSIVMIPENGVDTAFYVAKHDYESGLNGAGRVLMARKYVSDETVAFNNDGSADGIARYADGQLNAQLNDAYKLLLDEKVQEAIGETKFYYTPGHGTYSVEVLSRAVFTLSFAELDMPNSSSVNEEGTALPIASSLKIAYKSSGAATSCWTRSPYITANDATMAIRTNSAGSYNNAVANRLYSYRPCFTLPSDMQLSKTPNADGSYNLSLFPEEPSGYELIGTYTTSQTWVAPEDGWYQIEVFGASGAGGTGAQYRVSAANYNFGTAGSGGGGGYSCSRVKLKAGDTVELVVGQRAGTDSTSNWTYATDSSVVINSTVEDYESMSVTAGGRGGNGKATSSSATGGSAGTGGVASGGNVSNINGSAGKKGVTIKGASLNSDSNDIVVAGGAGANGAPAGGKGGVSNNRGGSGSAGFIKISRGDTNIINS